MTVGELKQWLDELPEECDDYDLVFRKLFDMKHNTKNKVKDGYFIAKDQIIYSTLVDDENKEIGFIDSKTYLTIFEDDSSETDEPEI